MSSNFITLFNKFRHSRAFIRITTGISLIFGYIILVWLSNSYNKYPVEDWRSDLYADKSGYYIYLPATFIYGFHQQKYPDKIDFRLGNGFGFVDGKLMTKYTCGVAMMNAPFFLAAHQLRDKNTIEPAGFSIHYATSARYAAAFYLLAGAVCLLIFLKRRFKILPAAVTILLLIFGSNLYHYAFVEPLMSHIYSFALFSLLLLLTDNFWLKPGLAKLAGIGLITGLIVLTRPTNLIFLPVILFLDVNNRAMLGERLRFLFSPVNILIFMGILLLIFIPQLIYWKFISGSFIFYSYQGEGFTYWANPNFLKVLFSPNNGLFPYTPVYAVILAGMVFMIAKNVRNGWLILSIFLAQLYIVSAWYMFFFGCSFGQRSFSEYLALFGLPVAGLASITFKKKNLFPGISGLILTLYLVFFNLRLTHAYDRCFLGKDWEWERYRQYIIRSGVFPLPVETFEWNNNFEDRNTYSTSGVNVTRSDQAFNGNFVNVMNETQRYSDGFGIDPATIANGKIFKIEASMWCLFEQIPQKVSFACSINSSDSTIYFSSENISAGNKLITDQWICISHTFMVPFVMPEGQLRVYMMSDESQQILNDDFVVRIYSEK
ncbi:MAG: hypothetical protein AB9834_04225 [Lentimicrobium sp.]